MAASLLLALLCLSAAGFACAAAWSRDEAGHARRWDAAFAFIVGVSAAELVLLASPLGLWFPWAATVGLVFPMLVGPFWWRSRDARQQWSWRRWVLQLVPGTALLVSTLATVAGYEGSIWNVANLPSVALVIAAAVANLAAGALRWPRSNRGAHWRWMPR
ncbi:hypothetical protein [Tahibacter caeni]|uniref:hypothetical protein n=1 Tax=Tahibacter caeni TaxID=1453545 RepID=UPI002147AF1B|nr:hypothetical protein [Tahibacter caeni]